MTKHGFATLRALILTLTVALGMSGMASGALAPRPGILWGATIGPQFTGQTAPWDPHAVQAFDHLVGRRPSLLALGYPMAFCQGVSCHPFPFPLPALNNARAAGALPVLSFATQVADTNGSWPTRANGARFSLAAIAAGRDDAYFAYFAREARAWGHPFFLRFDWEMNGYWFPWGLRRGTSPRTYVAAWRHVWRIFRRVGARNATWVWCPNVGMARHLRALYPGDRYVDWTCLDGYNWGNITLQGPVHWRTFGQLFGSDYARVTERIAPSKPMLIGEFATQAVGGDKAQWIAQALNELPRDFPRVRGIVYTESTDGSPYRWPLEDAPGAVAAFRAAIGSRVYIGPRFARVAAAPIRLQLDF